MDFFQWGYDKDNYVQPLPTDKYQNGKDTKSGE
jgi:hypothetical protein